MGMINEFKEFIARGNVVDLAVGVVIGAAFGKIVTALVDKVIMPPIGLLIGGVDFSSDWASPEGSGAGCRRQAEVPGRDAGIWRFLNTVIQFMIVAFAIFMVVKAYQPLRKPAEVVEARPRPTEEVLLLREIRDSLKK
jgi:large conductance mechanosensitive channel